MNKKLAYLEQLIANGQADSFARYALALELKKEERVEESLKAFESLREVDSQYLAQYLMAGQMLLDLERKEEARTWLESGLEVAQAQGDGKAISEIQGALSDC